MLFTNEERLFSVTVFHSEEPPLCILGSLLGLFSPVWIKPCQNGCTYLLEILSEFEAW